MGTLCRLFIAIAISAIVIFSHPFANAQNTGFAHVDGKFFERLDERGRVSGDIVMGVMIGPIQPDDDKSFEFADLAPRTTADITAQHLPEADSVSNPDRQEYCVRINSKDGRFEAENTYAVTVGKDDPKMPFLYGGEYAPDLTGMRAVTLVKIGRCGERTEVVVPSNWADATATRDEQALHVFVNSAGNPTGLAVGNSPYQECQDVADATTLKYTAACVVPVDLLQTHQSNGRVELTFYVTRSLGEEVFGLAIALPNDGS
ncbi:MAG: hypothetical protein AAFQ66_11600 [Pseudomonadota bacterium]